MSRRRSAGAGGSAAAASASGSLHDEISSVVSAEFAAPAAAAAAAVPMEEEGDPAEEEKEHAAAAAAAAPAAAARGGRGGRAAAAAAEDPQALEQDQTEMLKHFTSGMSWAPLSALCKEMQKQNNVELKELRGLHDGAVREATAAIRRAGLAKENDNPCKASVARWRRSLENLVAKEAYLDAHTETLRVAAERCTKGDVPFNVDWSLYMQQLDEETEGTPEHKARLEATLQKALKDFDDACWAVHHSGEDRGDSDDVQAVSANSSIGLKDPFTSEWLEQPVRAPECGHRYSRAALEASLVQAHRSAELRRRVPAADIVFSADFHMACQWPGCKKQISLASMVADPEAVRLVARARMEEQRNQAAAAVGAGSSSAAAAAAAASGARRKRGTVKEEKGVGGSFDLTQQDEMEDEPGAAAPAAGAAAASSPARRSAR